MTRRLPLLLRYLRMLVACAVLGVLPAPVSVAVPVDAVTWVAPSFAGGATREEHAIVARAPREMQPSRAPTALPALVVDCAPPRARTYVVHRRVYLKHAALLC